jgi:hypothetical protein
MSSSRSSRGNPAIGDIIRSVVVIGAVIVGLYGIGQLFTAKPESTVKPIDYASVVAQARPAATFPLLAPADLPKGWRATSARFQENGTADVAGQTWDVRTGPDGRLTYVRDEDGFTTLLNTSASRRVLEGYIASLSTS